VPRNVNLNVNLNWRMLGTGMITGQTDALATPMSLAGLAGVYTSGTNALVTAGSLTTVAGSLR